MAKTIDATKTNGRWLIIDTKSPSSDIIVASLKTIDGAEIKTISHKMYVRFNKPIQKSTRNHLSSRVTRAIRESSAKTCSDNTGMPINHYCAVVAK